MTLPTKLTKRDLFVVTSLILLFWFTRLPNLTNIPIFTDEAIYLRWSQIGSYDSFWRFIPLTDGKPPLFHWFVMATIRVFSDPLIAGRIVSVFSGFANLIGIWLLSYLLSKKTSLAHLASLLYIFSPFMLIYDRLSLVDSLLTTFSIFSLFFAVLLAKRQRLDAALLLGASVGAGMLTKTSGLLFLLLIPTTSLLFNWTQKNLYQRLFKWITLLAVSAIVSQTIYSILRLSRFFYRISQKNDEFIIPLSQFLSKPFSMTWGNAKSLFSWQLGYLSLPIALLIVIAFTNKKFIKQQLLLAFYYMIPFLLIASFNKIIFPRFLLFSTPFLLILAAFGINSLMDKTKTSLSKTLLIVTLVFLPATTSFTLITNPLKANIPQADRDQYLDSWPAGWGIKESVAFFKQQADRQPIHIGTQGTFGLMPYALEIYLASHPNVSFSSYWPVDAVPEEILTQTKNRTTYFIYNELEDIPRQDNLELIMEFEKNRLNEVRHMRIFKVNPKSN